ncbi:glycine C-acetyltransferase [Candidatus Uhrbacteria bacterium]|nr:glycine C-acetyltransferase [Candidatus Uhrbacteria bacterium]
MHSYQSQLQGELAEIMASGTYKEEKIISSRQGAEIEIDGKKLLNFCGNNYLGLAGSESLAQEACRAIDQAGYGMASVRFICGTQTIHKKLEERVARFFSFDDAILYSSCFDANAGLFETLLQAGDAVFSDELNHASIIDGIRLCKAERFRYPHSNMDELEQQLRQASGARRKMIATDGVFSMDGDTARLRAICDLAEKYGAWVMVDDSHGSGVLGANGRGIIEACGVAGRVDILTSTFGKALGGACGGFTAARAEIVEYLRQRSRPYLFSNSLPPVVAAVSLHVLAHFDTLYTAARKSLQEHTAYFRERIASFGYTLSGDGSHPITPVMTFDEKAAVEMSQALYEKGIYVRGFTYPVVPKGRARIRVQISAAHTREHLDRALEAFYEIKNLRP